MNISSMLASLPKFLNLPVVTLESDFLGDRRRMSLRELTLLCSVCSFVSYLDPPPNAFFALVILNFFELLGIFFTYMGVDPV
ncbi:MAG: hypothetical protein NHB32_25170 [Fischerella sp. CENA71]|nr:hypothetical protein [Fischerella sp. CENA71]